MLEWYEIAIIIVGVLGFIVGGVYAKKWQQMVKLLRELSDAFDVTADALEDKKLTKAEATELLKEWHDVYSALLALIGKK